MTKQERADEVKAIVDKTEPIAQWGGSSKAWSSPDGSKVRVYVNNKKAESSAWIDIKDDEIILHETRGNSMTRNAIAEALHIPMAKVRM